MYVSHVPSVAEGSTHIYPIKITFLLCMVPTRVKGQLFQIAIMDIIEYYSSLENMSVYYLNQKHFYLKQVLRDAFGAQARRTVISDMNTDGRTNTYVIYR